VKVLWSLAVGGEIGFDVVQQAIDHYGVDPDALDPGDPDNRPNPPLGGPDQGRRTTDA
jgi:hypothetical protein